MKNVKKLILSQGIFVIGTLWLLVIGGLYAVPASYWLVVKSVFVSDAVAGQPITMQVDREILRTFRGSYYVSIRKTRSEKTHIACTPNDTVDYHTGSELPEVVTMGWWTNGRCEYLTPGVYVVETTWRIHSSGLRPEKLLLAKSNFFTVK